MAGPDGIHEVVKRLIRVSQRDSTQQPAESRANAKGGIQSAEQREKGGLHNLSPLGARVSGLSSVCQTGGLSDRVHILQGPCLLLAANE